MAQSEKGIRFIRRDPLLLVLIVLVVLSLVPVPFLLYRLLNAGGGQGAVVAVLPTSTPVPTRTPQPTATPTPTPTATPTPTPTPLVGLLSGLPIDPDRLQEPPIVVMIPSDSDQYGLSQASVVYEAAAEYQIQRFMGVFEQVDAEKLGPIRSARSYYVEWAYPYAPLYVHWGGSPQAYDLLAEICCPRSPGDRPLGCLFDLDGQNGEYPFWRAEVVDIPWNNGFTSTSLLYRYIQEHAIARTVNYQGYPHRDDAPPETRPLTGTLAIDGAFRFSVSYSYDPQSNSYLRDYRSGPHIDLATGEQHRARNIVVMFVPESPIPDDPKGRLEIQTTGEGTAWVFQDGGMIQGRWVKEAPTAELRFYDEAGQEIAFNRGNIWIEALAIGQEQDVIYALGKPPAR
jgi:hypothetical protein